MGKDIEQMILIEAHFSPYIIQLPIAFSLATFLLFTTIFVKTAYVVTFLMCFGFTYLFIRLFIWGWLSTFLFALSLTTMSKDFEDVSYLCNIF